MLLLLGHQRSPNFSTSATLYLLTSILCDTIYLTLPSHIAGQSVSTTSIVLRCITHSVLLALENVPKHPAPDGKQSVEERHGILSRVLFLWIHPLLLKGYRNVLVDSDLPSLSRVIKPEFTRKAILRVWSHRGLSSPAYVHIYLSHKTSKTRDKKNITSCFVEMSEALVPCCHHSSTVLDCVPLFTTCSYQRVYQICCGVPYTRAI